MKSHDCTDTISLPRQTLTRPDVRQPAATGHWLARLWNGPVVALAYIWDCLYMWQERSEQRLQLRRLDDRMLSDIGLSRAEAEREGSKPFSMA